MVQANRTLSELQLHLDKRSRGTIFFLGGGVQAMISCRSLLTSRHSRKRGNHHLGTGYMWVPEHMVPTNSVAETRGVGQACMRREEGGGSWNPKACVPKAAQINISFCKFHFLQL